MQKEHTLWTILIRNMFVANTKWFYRNIKYLQLQVLQDNPVSRSVLGSAYHFFSPLGQMLRFYRQWNRGTIATAPLFRKEEEGERAASSLPNPDEMSYWKCRWPFAWRVKQWSCKDVRILVAGTCKYATSHAEGTLQTWLRWRTLACESPGFPGEPDLTVWILQTGGTFPTVVSQRDMTTNEWPERCNVAGLEDGGTGPHIKKHGQHPKTGSD